MSTLRRMLNNMLMAEMEEQLSQKQKATGYLTLSYCTHLI
jgi:hypothetical protein